MIFFAVTCVAHGPYRHPKQHESKKQVVLLVQCVLIPDFVVEGEKSENR
jgi:hypothetical protein